MASLAILETMAIGWDEEPQKRTEKKMCRLFPLLSLSFRFAYCLGRNPVALSISFVSFASPG